MHTTVLLAAIAVVGALGHLHPVCAAPITFKFSAIGNGWVRDTPVSDTRPFSSAAFTIRSTADTDDVVETSPGIYAVLNQQARIEVDGVGSGSFLIPTRIFVTHLGGGALGFSKVDFPPSVQYGADLIDFHSADFLTYALASSLGPVVDAHPFTMFRQFRDIPVGFGLLSFEDDYASGTFTAAIVPEPSSITFLALGLGGLGGLLWRRKSLAARSGRLA